MLTVVPPASDLARVCVAFVRSDDPTPTPLRVSMREIIERAQDPEVERIELLEDPEIPD